ncbi:MAG TPA: hypothetical protein VFQ96_03800 [Microbacteriaceae bacterium]|nr:hypothetical protein [Microbacteriaceae bacterium]
MTRRHRTWRRWLVVAYIVLAVAGGVLILIGDLVGAAHGNEGQGISAPGVWQDYTGAATFILASMLAAVHMIVAARDTYVARSHDEIEAARARRAAERKERAAWVAIQRQRRADLKAAKPQRSDAENALMAAWVGSGVLAVILIIAGVALLANSSSSLDGTTVHGIGELVWGGSFASIFIIAGAAHLAVAAVKHEIKEAVENVTSRLPEA